MPPRMSVYARFTGKDLPVDQRGLTSEHWNFGKDSFVGLDNLIVTVAVKIALFYANVVGGDLDEINDAIKRAGEAIAAYYLKEFEG